MCPADGTRRSLSRRRVVRALGGTALAALAGCAGDDESDDPVATTQADEASTSTPATTRTATPDEATVEGPDVDELEARLGDRSFEGQLFDTHAHWAGARDAGHARLDPQTFAARMAEHDVGACVLFTSSVDAAEQYPAVLEQLVTSDVAYLPFLQPQSLGHLQDGAVTTVHESHDGSFAGIGEIIFYGGPMQGTSITADPWPALFAFAAERDVPLMVHPTKAQADGLEEMLAAYPDATVMAHGGEFNLSPGTLRPLLEGHDNLYWTIDAGSMLNGLVLTASGPSEFASRYDQRAGEFHGLVEQVLPPLVQSAPDRVMWGTDLATDWNTDPQVYSRVMDWTRAAIESLPADQQDKYAYRNATRLFGL